MPLINKKGCRLALLSGLLLFFSFPKFGFAAIAWIALVPLLLALRGLKEVEGLRIGFLSGFIYNIGILYWISYVVETYGNAPAFFGVVTMLCLAALLSLFVSLFASLVIYFRNRGIPEVISAPIVWTCLEFVKSHVLNGFPWENLAYSQYSFPAVIQICDVTGVYGLSFLIVFANVVISDICLQKKPKWIAMEITAGFILFSMTLVYGLYRIDTINEISTNLKTQQVSLIQGNIEQNVKWKPEFQDGTLELYKNLTSLSAVNKPELIVWPETATPFYFQNQDDRHRKILSLARELQSPILFGSPSYNPKKGPEESLNSAFLISSEGKIIGQYNKVHLVPFGEYVPLRNILPFMSCFVAGVGDFRQGDEINPLMLNGHRIGILICYEAIFPEISRSYLQKGADLLVNLTNDAWFGNTSAPYQHLSMTVFRAVETRRYVVRAANTGISAIIGPTGKIVAETPLFQKTGLNGTFRFMNIITIYSLIGDLFAFTCFAFLGILIISTLRRNHYVRRIKRANCESGEQIRNASELSLKSLKRKTR